MVRVLKKIIIPIYCSRDAKVLYMYYYKMCEITKITFLKKDTKKHQEYTRSKKIFKKELLHKILIYLF